MTAHRCREIYPMYIQYLEVLQKQACGLQLIVSARSPVVAVHVSMVHYSSRLHNTLHFLQQVDVVPIDYIGAFRLQLNDACS